MADRRDALLVDLGGVVFAFDHAHRLQVLAGLLGWSTGRVETELWSSGFSADCDAGRYPTAGEVRGELRRRTGYAGSDQDLDAGWCSAFTPDPDVLACLARQPGRRYVLFTNNGPLEEDVLQRQYPEAFAPFAATIFAWRLAANKPEPAAYRDVERRLALPPDRITLVDDSEENVAVARARGWRAVRYRAVADLDRALADEPRARPDRQPG